jgi:hypothetical protein
MPSSSPDLRVFGGKWFDLGAVALFLIVVAAIVRGARNRE